MIITSKGDFENTIALEETFRAPKDKVFKAWTTPDSLKKWFMAEDGVTVTDVNLALEVDGAYSIKVIFPGDFASSIDGNFIKVAINEALEYTWTVPQMEGRQTYVDVTFRDLEQGSKINLSHGKFKSEEELQLHFDGWTGCIRKLHEYLAA